MGYARKKIMQNKLSIVIILCQILDSIYNKVKD